MTIPFESARQANPYATERYPVDDTWSVEIEFSKDGNMHSVWPYLSRGAEFLSGKIHVEVPGGFETHWEAREAAIARVEDYLRPGAADPYRAPIC
jgi:hypothetical protein